MVANSESLAELSNVYIDFDGYRVLKGVNLTINEEDRAVITGPSGSGKSTVMRALCGLETPSSGVVSLFGLRISGPSRRRKRSESVMSSAVNSRLGIVFQRPNLLEGYDPITNITMLGAAKGMRIDNHRVARLANAFNLDTDRLGRLQDSEKLSGGEKARVASMRALYHRPELLLMDEPTSTLDPDNRERFNMELTQLCEEEGITAVMVTHDPEGVGVFATRHLVMREGLIEERPSNHF